MKTKKDTEKGEMTTGGVEKVTQRPFGCVLVLDGEEKAHSSRGKGAQWGNYSSKVGLVLL